MAFVKRHIEHRPNIVGQHIHVIPQGDSVIIITVLWKNFRVYKNLRMVHPAFSDGLEWHGKKYGVSR